MIVDDDDAIRVLVSRVLERAGYRVKLACDGLEALKLIDATPPDLVISDINMPELDGFAMVEGLRNRAETEKMPVIFITASEDSSLFIRSANLKARSFLIKPFTNDKLVEKVRLALGR
ncbi:MAG: response regulator [Myxococcota bacterium]